MAITATTLSGAVVVDQNTISVASATGFAAGNLIRIDDEILEVSSDYISGTSIGVLRGREGTATTAHPTAALVVTGLGSDFVGGAPQTTSPYPIAARARPVKSYSAAGAIDLPTPGSDLVAVINGTGALAMTLAVPTKDMDGCQLIIASNGKAAHTVTASGGFGANTTNSDVMTFHATQTQAITCVACNGVWVLVGHVAGAATVAGAGLA